MIKKKYGFIILGLALLMFILFGIFSILENRKVSPFENDVNYEYVKSHDIKSRTLIKFPVLKNMHSTSSLNQEYNKNYSNENGLVIKADVFKFEDSFDEKINEITNDYKSQLDELNYTVDIYNIECSHSCKRYLVYDSDKEIIDELRIYIKLSDIDMVGIILQSTNIPLSNDLIEFMINNITIMYDAKYTIGILDGNNLVVKFNLGTKIASIRVDSSKYKELEKEINNQSLTTLVNENNFEIYLLVIHKLMTSNIKNEIDTHYNLSNPGSNVKEIKINDKTFYEYDMGVVNSYGYIIDEDSALLISSNDAIIDINDFTNITIEGA